MSHAAPAFAYVIVYVPAVAAAVAFYARAFGVSARFVHPSGQYAELETGATALAFANEEFTPSREVFERNRPHGKAAGAEVAFVVDDVPAAFARALDEGATAAVEPSVKPRGQTVAYLRDLNGFLVELCTAMGG